MGEVTRILTAIERGESGAAEQLLPLVYEELRRLAAQRMARELPGQTLEPTALVHEAYIRLVDSEQVKHWDSRGHFFTAAAESMRRILVENARRKKRVKHGGEHQRVDLRDDAASLPTDRCDILSIDEALIKFAAAEPKKAEFVNLRYFAGLSVEEAADVMGISRATASRYWTYAKAWLYCEIEERQS